MIWGIPFKLFWLVAWIVLTPLCMWAAYRTEVPLDSGTVDPHKDGRAH